MNAKKIMGAVLVALLAAALFVGAGAAADTKIGGTVFVNQALPAELGLLTWTDKDGAVVSPLYDPADMNKIYFPTAGIYTALIDTVELTFTVVSPAATISGLVGSDTTAYQFIPGTYYIGSGTPEVNVLPAVKGLSYQNDVIIPAISGYTIFLTLPNGSEVNTPVFADELDAEATVGEYFITVVYNADNFVNGTFVDQMGTKPVSFMVAEAGDVTISASVDQALKGESFIITITGQPGIVYQVTYGEGDFKPVELDQKSLFNNEDADYIVDDGETVGFYFTMPNTGKIDIVIASESDAEESEKITVTQDGDSDNNDYVTIKLAKGTISAKTEAAAYFVGDKVKITGISTAGKIDDLELEGRNFEAEPAVPTNVKYGSDLEMTFEFELDTSKISNEKKDFEGKMIDVGTYTLTIITETGAKATVPVTLKQPFISIVEAPEVIVKGNEAEFIINAEATEKNIQFYIFGTNFFLFGDQNDVEQGDEIKTQYTVKFTKEYTKNLSEGQYFAVFQHPMYDQEYNITAEGWTILKNDKEVIDVKERQTANAAQALCDELDAQNIDDMYVKASFFVVGKDQSFTISDIPKEVAKGTTFTISGVDTANAGKTVQVEMISTAFAAVPKETVGSAAFIVVTTEVAEDGTWEVTMDTSDLNVDEYSLSVACDGQTWKSVNINVVEAADEPVTPPTDEPGQDEPGQDEPVAPETPGFGALAALAGLGAVAVLLLRRE